MIFGENAALSCGTPEQVVSILNHFKNDPDLDVIAQGTVFGPKTLKRNIFPHIVSTYPRMPTAAFDVQTQKLMNDVHGQTFDKS